MVSLNARGPRSRSVFPKQSPAPFPEILILSALVNCLFPRSAPSEVLFDKQKNTRYFRNSYDDAHTPQLGPVLWRRVTLSHITSPTDRRPSAIVAVRLDGTFRGSAGVRRMFEDAGSESGQMPLKSARGK